MAEQQTRGHITYPHVDLLGLRAHWAVRGSHAFIITHSKLPAQDLVGPCGPWSIPPTASCRGCTIKAGPHAIWLPVGQETPYLLDMA